MKKLLLANFKSNKSITEAQQWLDTFIAEVDWSSLKDDGARFEVAVAPAFVSLGEFAYKIEEASVPLLLSVQDISAYPAGSYTGAISVANLAELNIAYAIIGHSERRKHFGENSAMVAKKVEQALDGGITPIVCFDEEYLEEQISNITAELVGKCVFVYEPLGAIGTGNNVGVGKVTEVKEKVKRLCGEVRFLYGGSVDDQNVAEYLLVTDGVLVGTFSKDPLNFAQLVATATAV